MSNIIVFKQGSENIFIYKDGRIIFNLLTIIDKCGKYSNYDSYMLNSSEILCIKPCEDKDTFIVIRISRIDVDDYVEVWYEYKLSQEIDNVKTYISTTEPYTYFQKGFAKLVNTICNTKN